MVKRQAGGDCADHADVRLVTIYQTHNPTRESANDIAGSRR